MISPHGYWLMCIYGPGHASYHVDEHIRCSKKISLGTVCVGDFMRANFLGEIAKIIFYRYLPIPILILKIYLPNCRDIVPKCTSS